jgi:DNA-binding MarR family transcriptional regulator
LGEPCDFARKIRQERYNSIESATFADYSLLNQNPKVEFCAVPRQSQPEEHLAYVIASLNRQLEEDLQESLRPEGIAIEQFRILSTLDASDGRPMGELASAVLVDPATLTKIVDRMVTDALVYRAPSAQDRRRVLIFTAPKGKALYKRLKGITRNQQKCLMERLDKAQAEDLTRVLRGLIRP